MGRRRKMINLPDTKLKIKGVGYDYNGNKILKIHSDYARRGFTVPIEKFLPETSFILQNYNSVAEMNSLARYERDAIAKEVADYVMNFGTERQKSMLH